MMIYPQFESELDHLRLRLRQCQGFGGVYGDTTAIEERIAELEQQAGEGAAKA
jgi:hypothetical protein